MLFVNTPLDLMIQTERDFSRTSREKGMRDAFISFISEDGILFRPGPVQGKQWLKANPPVTGVLSWQPVYADISSAGDLGFTTGPFVYKSEKGAQNGTYFTIWKMQPDGNFKFVIDFGISHPAPESQPTESFPDNVPVSRKTPDSAGTGSAAKLLLNLDRKFSEDSASKGTVPAFEAWSASNVRLLRDTKFPAVGKTAALVLVQEKPGTLTWEPEKAHCSDSADLGYTYGKISFRAPAAETLQEGYYLRVWKFDDGQWKVVADIMNY
jgi:ketosteroid isomerase-like protein